ncbi:MAG: STAS domain-containing protein [Treponema sp.]|jgi:anti-anti-sigma factor|nr:STAS domain-containing protein [Treponema sp.]
MDQLDITESEGANYNLMVLKGTLDAYTLSEFQRKLYDYIQRTNVVLDLSELAALDSTGMGVIMAGVNDGQDSGYRVYLMNPSPEARSTIESTGFYDYFDIINAVTEIK